MAADRSDRLYPTRPLVAVGAVVWDGGRVLLERRGQPPAQGSWAIPGGLVELGETAESAIRREVQEECGIEIEVGPVLGLFEPIHRDADGRIRYHFTIVDFLAYYRAGELRAGDDAADVRWVSPDELSQFELNAATREMIAEALRRVHDARRSRRAGARPRTSVPLRDKP
jgi:8-oxo-dGTP diphosphatase